MQYAPTPRAPSCAILSIPIPPVALRAIAPRHFGGREAEDGSTRPPSAFRPPPAPGQASAMLSIRRVVPIRAAMTRRAPASTMAGGSIVSPFTTSA